MHRPILLLTSLVTLAGCGGGTPANQAGQAAAPGQPPAQISIATPEGRAEIRSGTGAASYPEGIPPYPGASADQSVDVSGTGARGGGRILGFRTGDPAPQVIGFYADAAARAGYTLVSRMDAGPGSTLVLRRGENESVSISATRIGDFTQGQIVTATR